MDRIISTKYYQTTVFRNHYTFIKLKSTDQSNDSFTSHYKID